MAVDRYGEPIEQADGGDGTERTRAARAARPLQWEDVPAGTPPSICTGHQKPDGSCMAEVYWITRSRMKQGRPIPGTSTRVPVDCDITGGSRPDSWTAGRGVNHYGTCVDAGKF